MSGDRRASGARRTEHARLFAPATPPTPGATAVHQGIKHRMRLLLTIATALLAVTASAQSPLSLPFNSNSTSTAPAGVYFNLTVVEPTGITITALDVNTNTTVGTIGSVEVYTTPTTYVGVQTTPAAWTLAASGAAMSAGLNLPTSVCLSNGGVFLATGSYGVFVRHVGLALRTTIATATVTASTAELQFSGGQSQASTTLFSSTPTNNRIFNGNIRYNVGNVPGPACVPFASKATYGVGCLPSTGDSWYESFTGLTTFDLAGGVGTEVVLVATPIGAAGYTVSSGPSAWFTPTSPKLLSNATTPATMTDDTMSDDCVLPFAFPYPGGSVTTMHAAVNGFIHLGATTLTSSDFSPTAAEMHTLQPRLFPCWADWHASQNATPNPATGVYFDVDPSGQTVYFTWLDVADRRGQLPTAGTTAASFQCAIHSNGSYEFRYRSFVPAAAGVGAVMVGYSKGNNNVTNGPISADTGSRDLTVVPFSTNGPDTFPLAVDGNTPRLGQNWTITTTGVDPLSPITVTFFGTARVDPGLDLGFLGAPGCSSYINIILDGLTGTTVGTTSTINVAVPNNPAVAGFVLTAQSVCLTLQNALGLRTSNGLEGVVGQ
jgi:hypothetical protein